MMRWDYARSARSVQLHRRKFDGHQGIVRAIRYYILHVRVWPAVLVQLTLHGMQG